MSLLHYVLSGEQVEIEQCARCGGRLNVIASI
jgi:hypothetical protein